MALFKNKYRIESARLDGWYFLTICTKNWVRYFGEVIGDEMELNKVGLVAERCWKEVPKHFSDAQLDDYIIMPNHVHGIIIIQNDDCRDAARQNKGRDVACNVSTGLGIKMSSISPKRNSLSIIVRSYKSAVTKHCHDLGINDFEWQSRFYDHIISSDKELLRVQEYIESNVINWAVEKNHYDEYHTLWGHA